MFDEFNIIMSMGLIMIVFYFRLMWAIEKKSLVAFGFEAAAYFSILALATYYLIVRL